MGSDIFNIDPNGKVQPPPKRTIRRYTNQESEVKDQPMKPAIKKISKQNTMSENNPFYNKPE